MRARSLANYLLPLSAAVFAVAMVIYPELAMQAAVKGLKLWWDIVFPALLPFFVASELMMGLGVVHFMGVLLEPFMRPLFDVPGVGSFVLAMGFASGYPIGAVLTGKLRRQGLVSKTEGERLMSFTNTSDPLFMAGAVAVGMLGRPDLAGIIIGAHYLAGLSTGLILRFYRFRSADRVEPIATGTGQGNMLARAVRAMNNARREDGRALGDVLGDSVRNSINTLLLVGGFIILFSVIISMLKACGAIAMIGSLLSFVLRPLGFSPAAVQPLVAGLFEITLGCEMTANSILPLTQKVMLAGAIIAWSGLSVHAQVAAVIKGTDLAVGPYTLSRIVHGLFAGFWTWVLMSRGAPAMARLASPFMLGATVSSPLAWVARLGMFGERLVTTVGIMAVAAAVAGLLRSVRIISMRVR
ncbi:MAG: sporulation integral membrane protein YlbJ [Chloroflexota bacterium]